jgi:hypothetical protein
MSASKTLNATQVWEMFLATQSAEAKAHLTLPPAIAPPKTAYLNAPKPDAKGLGKWCASYLKADLSKAVVITEANGRLLERMTILRCWANCLKVKMFLPGFEAITGWDLVVDDNGDYSADAHTILYHPPTDSWIDLTAYPQRKGDRLFVRDGLKPNWTASDWLCPDKADASISTSVFTKASERRGGGKRQGGPCRPEDAEFEIYGQAVTELCHLSEASWKITLGDDRWAKFLVAQAYEPDHKDWWSDYGGEIDPTEVFNKSLGIVQQMWETGNANKPVWAGKSDGVLRMAHHFGVLGSLRYKALIKATPGITMLVADGTIKVAYFGQTFRPVPRSGLEGLMRFLAHASGGQETRQSEQTPKTTHPDMD